MAALAEEMPSLRSVAAFALLSALTWASRSSIMGFTLLVAVGIAVLGWHMAGDDAGEDAAAAAAKKKKRPPGHLTLAKETDPQEQEAAAAASSGPVSFAESSYRRLLSQVGKEPTKAEVRMALRDLLLAYLPLDAADKEVREVVTTVEALLAEASYSKLNRLRGVLRGQMQRSPTEKTMWAALRLWSSDRRIASSRGKVELCSLLNHAIREDREPALRHALVLTRAINLFCTKPKNTRRLWGFYESETASGRNDRWPNGRNSDAKDTTFRGGGLPDEHRAFFAVGRRFRSRMFVASSFRRRVALYFMKRQKNPRVLWTLRFDAENGCQHVNLLRRADGSQIAEAEFLLSPYTAFEVIEVARGCAGTDDDPHRITLAVAHDNQCETWPEDLPLAPWS